MEQNLGLIAGKGDYPKLVLEGICKAKEQSSVGRVVVAAFEGETDEELAGQADGVQWLKVGQLGKMLSFFKREGARKVIMAGQITPRRLFDLRPDLKALALLAGLKEKNAETIFGAVADELERNGIQVLPATTYVEEHLAAPGHFAGPKAGKKLLGDVQFGWPIAKQVSALNIGQTIVVKNGTVLAVEGFEGTDEAIRRGGKLGEKGAVVLKVSKPNQDFRFDVPVIGPETLHAAAEGKIGAIVCEAGKTLLLNRPEMEELARENRITLLGKTDTCSS